VTPDRQPDTVEKRRKGDLHLATWNVRTLYQAGKLENVKQEMKRLRITILGMSETRWSDSGLINTDSMKFIYPGGDKHERGVGVILDQNTAKCLEGYWPISDRVLLVKINSAFFKINIIQVYAPTADANEETIDRFYDDLD
jgi:exonuclease III